MASLARSPSMLRATMRGTPRAFASARPASMEGAQRMAGAPPGSAQRTTRRPLAATPMADALPGFHHVRRIRRGWVHPPLARKGRPPSDPCDSLLRLSIPLSRAALYHPHPDKEGPMRHAMLGAVAATTLLLGWAASAAAQ